MRIADAAKQWGISERSLYRLVQEGIIPATVRVRDSPLVGYDIEEDLVSMVKAGIQDSGKNPTPELVRKIIKFQNTKEVNKC